MPIGFYPLSRTRNEAARGLPGKANWLLQGLATPNATGDFVGAFQAGLGGALGAKQAAGEAQDAEAQRQLANDMAQREYELNQRKVATDEGQLGETIRSHKANELLQALKPVDSSISELDLFRTNPEQWKKYMDAKKDYSGNAAFDIPLTEGSIKAFARQWARGAGLPPFARTKVGMANVARIVNYATEHYPNLDLASAQSGYKAKTDALKQLTVNRQLSAAFEKTALYNADILKNLADKIPDTGTQFGNFLMRTAQSQFGDPDVPAYQNALKTVRNEFQRILESAGAGGASQLHVEGMKDMKAVLSGNFTKQQLMSALNVLYLDAENKQRAYEEQTRNLMDDISWNEELMNPNYRPAPRPNPFTTQGPMGNQMQLPNGELIQVIP